MFPPQTLSASPAAVPCTPPERSAPICSPAPPSPAAAAQHAAPARKCQLLKRAKQCVLLAANVPCAPPLQMREQLVPGRSCKKHHQKTSSSLPFRRKAAVQTPECMHANRTVSSKMQHKWLQAHARKWRVPFCTWGTCWSGQWCARSRRGRRCGRTASSPAQRAASCTVCTPCRRTSLPFLQT